MRWLAVALLLGASSSARGNEAAIRSAVTPLQMKTALIQADLTANLQSTSDGPQVLSRLGTQPFTVFFFGCTAARAPKCRELQFYAGFPIDGIFPSAGINAWNGAHRFGRAYIDNDGNAALEMDLDAVGTSDAQIKDSIEWWKTLVPQFAAFLDQSMKPQISPSAQRARPPATSNY